MFLIIFTYVFSLKSKGLNILILLELELIFLAALLLAPAVTQGLAFFSGVEIWIFYHVNHFDHSCFLQLPIHCKTYSKKREWLVHSFLIRAKKEAERLLIERSASLILL